jgi:hypothetical protein
MVKRLLVAVLAVLLSAPVYAQDSRHSLSGHSLAYAHVTRDSHGRIKRSASARREFMQETGYAHGRPGYVIDHIVPLACGGPDDPSNMQWQTIADAKAKDRWERIGCSSGNPDSDSRVSYQFTISRPQRAAAL